MFAAAAPSIPTCAAPDKSMANAPERRMCPRLWEWAPQRAWLQIGWRRTPRICNTYAMNCIACCDKVSQISASTAIHRYAYPIPSTYHFRAQADATCCAPSTMKSPHRSAPPAIRRTTDAARIGGDGNHLRARDGRGAPLRRPILNARRDCPRRRGIDVCVAATYATEVAFVDVRILPRATPCGASALPCGIQ